MKKVLEYVITAMFTSLIITMALYPVYLWYSSPDMSQMELMQSMPLWYWCMCFGTLVPYLVYALYVEDKERKERMKRFRDE